MMTEHMTTTQYRKLPPRVGGRRVTPETALKAAGKQWLGLHGWLVYALPASPYGLNGLPDSIAIKEGRTVYLEFKSGRGVLSEYQELRRQEIEAAGGTYLVVRSLEDLEGLL